MANQSHCLQQFQSQDFFNWFDSWKQDNDILLCVQYLNNHKDFVGELMVEFYKKHHFMIPDHIVCGLWMEYSKEYGVDFLPQNHSKRKDFNYEQIITTK